MLPHTHLAPGTLFAGDFRVVRPLAEGGMGAVYVAEQLSTGKARALKIMHPALAPDATSRARFVEEARVGGKIASDHVVEVVGAGVDGPTGVPWLAMELLEGQDLGDVVRARGALPPAEVLELVRQLAHALGAAHRLGIVHRDLKPENLFVARSRRSAEGSVLKILDFGIARMVEGNQTAATVTSAIGSPLWMAPEQAQPGAKLRPATDVWALGLIVFHCLTGRSYWRAANHPTFNLSALLVEALTLPLDPASARAAELGAHVPPGFDAWFARCVDRDPMRRFADATAAADALGAALAPGALAPARAAGARADAPHPAPTLPLGAAAPALGYASAPNHPGAPPGASAPARVALGLVVAVGLGLVALGAVALVALGALGGTAQLASAPPPRPIDVVASPAPQTPLTPLEARAPAPEVDAIPAPMPTPPPPEEVAPPPAAEQAPPARARTGAAPRARAGAEEAPPLRVTETARVRSGNADVRGSLSRDVIRRVITRDEPAIRRCYERGLAVRPTLEGRVTVRLVIAPTGTVQSAAIGSSTLGAPDVESCIVSVATRWRFPSPDGGGVVMVDYPFILSRG
ncbi:MAG: AgmX/PglI C-terminal domain-containing protein [Sandaracinaceae bacterium]|nr:AgmX/PglI C-terminal domain-containing protein [Sandaracinaceae bacterium]